MVGYQKINLQKGFNLVGVQFTDIGGAEKDIGTVVTLDASYAGYDDDYKFFSELQTWDGRGYDTYYWAGTSGTEVDGEPELDNTWTDRDACAVEGVSVPASSAMWINAEKAGTLLVSGEVPTSEIVVPLSAGWNLVSNPFPEDVSVTTYGILDSSYAGYDDDYKFFTELQTWDGRGYDTYYWAGTSGTDVDGEPELDNTWVDRDACAVDVVIPYGAGVWIKAEKAGTITFSPNL